jgi:CheY-like chemotaxis protein
MLRTLGPGQVKFAMKCGQRTKDLGHRSFSWKRTMEQTVLIVEDCEDSATTIELALQAIRGVRVRLLSSAREALVTLFGSADHVAVLVTDLHMPSMDGFELIKRIRSDRRYDALPIVVVSGDTRADTLERVSCLGAEAFFPKPYSPKELRRKIESLLNAP